MGLVGVGIAFAGSGSEQEVQYPLVLKIIAAGSETFVSGIFRFSGYKMICVKKTTKVPTNKQTPMA